VAIEFNHRLSARRVSTSAVRSRHATTTSFSTAPEGRAINDLSHLTILVDFDGGLSRLAEPLSRQRSGTTPASSSGRLRSTDWRTKHLASPQGEGLTRPQAFAHVVVDTDQGRSLFAADNRQRGIL
jgi:hypothetical protein